MLRLLLAWLLLVAVPLQGVAAASMLYCGPNAQHAGAHATAPEASGHHDHSAHAHPASDATDAMDAMHAAEPGKPLPDASHKCGVCASCCNIVAITGLPQWPAFSALPRIAVAEPFVLIQARPSPVPDKPPRV